MRVLLLVDGFDPDHRPLARKARDLAVALQAAGHVATIVAPEDGPEQAPRVAATEGGVPLVRIALPARSEAGRLRRGLRSWRLSGRMWRAGRDWFTSHPQDLIVFFSPGVFLGPLVARLRKLWGCRAYLVLRELVPETALDVGLLTRLSPAHRILRRYVRLQYRAADVIGVHAPGDVDAVARHLLKRPRRVEVLPGWTRLVPPPAAPKVAQGAAPGDGTIRLLFAGPLTRTHAPDLVLDLAADLTRDGRVRVEVVGDGPDAARLATRIAAERLETVSLLGPLPEAALRARIAASDLGLICLDPRLRSNLVPPELLLHAAHGRAVLAAVAPTQEVARLVVEGGIGLAVAPQDRAGFAAAARRLLADPVLRAACGARARLLVETRFAPDTAARRILAAAVA